MIVSLWMAYIAARKGTGVHTAASDTPDGPATQFDAPSMVSWCLPKGEEQISGLFRRMLEMWTGLWAGQRADQRAEPNAERTSAPSGSPHLSSPRSQDNANLETQTSEQMFLKDTVRIFTWSKACCVHHVSSVPEDEETENRPEQTENDMPQLLLQDRPDLTMDAMMDAATRSMTDMMTDTDIQFDFPKEN